MTRIAIPAALSLFLLSGVAQANGPYELPLRANDLESNERYSTKDHGGSNQTEGKDFGARRLTKDSIWSDLKTDGAGKDANPDWLIYGKPFYAMAPGIVVGCWRNAPDDPPVGEPEGSDSMPSSGNHIWIRQDDGIYALYAHAKPGSIPPNLCPHNATLLGSMAITKTTPFMRVEAQVADGARVEVGDKLGEAGNSGNSGGPHLHAHMEKDGKPIVMTFKRGMTTSFEDEKGNIDGPWTSLGGKALPNERILVWAPHRIGNYTFNGVLAANYQRMVDHLANSGLMPDLISCKSNGATYDTRWVPTKGVWASFHGMSASEAAAKHAEYTGKGYTRSSTFTCGSVSVAVWRKG
jgi:hypothetical protein